MQATLKITWEFKRHGKVSKVFDFKTQYKIAINKTRDLHKNDNQINIKSRSIG
jgi:hypothetical protein